MKNDQYEISRIDEINADIFLPKENQRGIGGIIVGDDGSSLICGSLHPLSYYIEQFKNRQRDNI